ncbi:Storkhead-box protein 1 [Lucilia cuprina]|nr:Storkhead-box protein 1 [Lucilia cuprina]
MGTKSPGGPQRCRLILKQCIAVQLSKPGHTLDDFWMYDSGYMVFQNFLSANAQCWWNAPLTAATRALKYAGHVAPGMLLVSGEPCALEVVRGAYARSVLKPPATYVISSVVISKLHVMSQPTTKFDLSSAINPLQDEEFSELTKQEIIFWSHKLKITPSQLFSLSKKELEIIMQNAIKGEKNQQERHEQTRRWEKLSKMKRKLIENHQKNRLRGGAGPDLLEILARAADEIEYMYGSRYGTFDTSGDMTYDSSFETTDESPFCYSLYSDEEASYESAAEDYSFNIDENLASTPYSGCPKRQLPRNNTFCAPKADATFNATCPKSSFKLSDVTPPTGMRSVKHSSYNLADVSPPSGMQMDNWSPQQVHHIDNISGVSKAPSFRNYTDYSIQFSPTGTEETANSISVENYDETSGKVTASSRTFTLPPATTPTNALELSNITPPTMASGCVQRAIRGVSLDNDLSNISQPLLASGCIRSPTSNLTNISPPALASGCIRRPARRNDLSNISPPNLASGCIRSPARRRDLSNISPPILASGCPRNIRYSPSTSESPRHHLKSTPGDLSNVTAPALASGCYDQASQLRNITYDQCPTQYSFDTENIPAPLAMSTAQRCPIQSAHRAKTPLRIRPNRPYRDIDDCIVTPIMQGQFTPLPEALCDVIMDLTAEGHSATIENIRTRIEVRFPHMTPPSIEVIYDSLAQLMQEQKIYQTAKGYFILTPERRRSRSRPRSHHNGFMDLDESTDSVPQEPRTMLMTNAEALHSLYGEISTERDGDLTHQCIQTNLADVICGGNSNDKILYPRTSKRRSSSFPTPRSLERRHSLRLFGSSKRLQRCASTRSLSKTYAQTLNTDSSSSEYQSTDSSSPKKGSLLSRLFRRSGRNKARQLETYSGQFPPAEWFNSKAVHLHSVGTQTQDHDMPTIHTLSNSTFYDGSELSQRSLTLPRRHRRNLSSESTFLISSRDCSPIRRRSPAYCSSSLPRSTQSIPATANGNSSTVAATKGNQSAATLSARTSTPYKSSQKSIQSGSVARHMLEHSPSRSANSSQKSTNSGSRSQETRNDYRMWQSGPSSLESGKTSLYPSGPSSIDSGKVSYNRASGHSSLESQRSTSSTVIQPRSIIMLNGSPRGTPRHQILRARNAEQVMRNQSSTTTSTSFPINETRSTNSRDTSNSEKAENAAAITNSTSNNSITLKLTTSNDGQHNLPNTKIVVQNTPAHSVITFENSKLTENSNVFIINNETTTNERGEIIRKTLSKQHMPAMQQSANDRPEKSNHQSTETVSEQKSSENGSCRESDADTLSYMSTLSVDKSNDTNNELPKFSKNIYNDNTTTTMNNSRNLGLPLLPTNTGHLIYKNNVLKNSDSPAQSPSEEKSLSVVELSKPKADITGSVGNLRFYEKNSKDSLAKAINSNCELNNLRYESSTLLAKNDNLNSNTSLSGGSLVQILQKNSISLGSEPNLAQKDTNCATTTDKSVRKDTLDRRLSLSKDHSEAEDLFNFPSLTDLSFNFTSLAAQKILQGVSLNSIDTLMELNMAAAAAAAAAANNTNASAMEKPQNNQPTSVCTDFGLV